MPISWPFPPKDKPSPLQRARSRIERIQSKVSYFLISHHFSKLPTAEILLVTFGAGSIGSFASYRIYLRYFRRLRNTGWVTPDVLASGRKGRVLRGYVTSVGDADNFRFYHTPGFGWNWLRRIPTTKKDLKGETLHIRIAGVDAPEAAHFGREAQPYAQEALDWLQQRIRSKTVSCQLLSKDQYGRVVSIVTLQPRILPAQFFRGRNLALDMLQAGWATTYKQAGAQYGPDGKEEFLRIEAAAKAAKRGQWVSGVKGESPAEYKKRHANGETAEKKTPKASSPTPQGLLARFWFGPQ